MARLALLNTIKESNEKSSVDEVTVQIYLYIWKILRKRIPLIRIQSKQSNHIAKQAISNDSSQTQHNIKKQAHWTLHLSQNPIKIYKLNQLPRQWRIRL